MYSKIIICGRLGKDPEMSFTKAGDPYTSIAVAVNNKKKGSEDTTWYRVTAWRKQAEFVVEYLHKGAVVLVDGSLRLSEFKGRDGETKFSLDVDANTVQAIGGKNEKDASPY